MSRFRITHPCPLDWSALTPSDEGRYCSQCDRTVHILSRMSRSEAGRFLDRHDGERVCGMVLRDDRGTALFRDSPALIRALATGSLVVAGLGLAYDAAADAAVVVPVVEDEVPATVLDVDLLDPATPDAPLLPMAAPVPIEDPNAQPRVSEGDDPNGEKNDPEDLSIYFGYW